MHLKRKLNDLNDGDENISQVKIKKIKKEERLSKLNQRKEKAKETLKKCDNLIKNCLSKESFDSIFMALNGLASGSRFLNLEVYLKQTNYSLFDWALENEHLPLLNYFLEEIRPEQRLLLVSHDEYAHLKKFVDDLLALSEKAYLASSSTKISILNTLFDIDPDIKETVCDYVNALSKEGLDAKNLGRFTTELKLNCQTNTFS